MRCAIAALVFFGLSPVAITAQSVDRALVGTWEMEVPNIAGTAKWIWEVRANGTYSFHAEGPGNTPAHYGAFQAANGRYTLKAANIAWVDNGTYDRPANNLVRMTGRLGTGYWKRVAVPAAEIGLGVDGDPDHFDAAASARIKAKNKDKIFYSPGFAALGAGMAEQKPIVLFYSGGLNLDAALYSDAMVALADRAEFGLVTKLWPDPAMTNVPQTVASDANVYPRILIVTPLYTIDQLAQVVKKNGPGSSVTTAKFESEIQGSSSGANYAAAIGAALKKLGH